MTDWDAWARKAEQAIENAAQGDWYALFAPGATFEDPHSARTTDLKTIHEHTAAIFPDWRQEITSIRGGEDWAVWEWIGTATFTAGPAKAAVRMSGVTLIEVDADGLVTSWRDYLDRKQPEEQIIAALQAPSA